MTYGGGRHAAHYRAREDLVDRLRRDLLGPDDDADRDDREEILTHDAPITRYPIGVLFPQAANKAASERLTEDYASEDGLDEAPVLSRDNIEESTPNTELPAAGDRKPSSMGLTFAIDPAVCSEIVVTSSAAVYDPIDASGRPVSPGGQRSAPRPTNANAGGAGCSICRRSGSTSPVPASSGWIHWPPEWSCTSWSVGRARRPGP